MAGEQHLDHVRRLAAVMQREAGLRRIEARDHRPSLGRDAGMAGEAKAALDDRVGRGERGLDVAGRDFAPIEQVVAELGMQHRRVGRQRVLELAHHRKLVPVDPHQLRRILGDGTGLRGDCDDRLTLPAGALDRERVLRRRAQRRSVGHGAPPRRHPPGELGAGDHAGDAVEGQRLGAVDAVDPGMGVRASHKGQADHAGQRQIIDIGAAPGDRAARTWPGQRASDDSVRPIEG